MTLPPLDQPYSDLATVEDLYYCYRLLLARNPDEHGWNGLSSMVGGMRLDDLLLIFLSHPEFKGREVYRKMLGGDDSLPRLAQAGNVELYVSANDSAVGQQILSQGVHEPHVTRAIERSLRPGMVFLDIGANVGYFSLLAARQVGEDGRVIAFEPDQRNCAFLALSAARNGLSNVAIYPLAASDENTTVVLDTLVGSNGIISQALGETGEAGIEQLAHKTLVRAVRLDELLSGLERLDILKMDIEGAEYRALMGARGLIERHRPLIFSEFSPGWLPDISGITGERYLAALVDLGYTLSVIAEDGELVPMGPNPREVLAYFAANAIDHIDLFARPLVPAPAPNSRARSLARRLARLVARR